MLKSDATPVRKAPSARDGNPVAREDKRTQVVAGFLRQREPAELVAELVIDQTPSQDAEPATEPLRSSAAAHSAGEIELKLVVDAGRMAHFNAAPVIAVNARNKGTRKRLKSVYYDSPERMLRRNGL